MELEDQVVSLELSKKLKELGVKQESLWSWWITTDRDDTPTLNRSSSKNCPICGHPRAPYFAEVAAFTVAELGEMLPQEILVPNKHYKARRHLLRFGRYSVGPGLLPWYIRYVFSKVTHFEQRGETEANVRAKMLIYLIENKLISITN